MTRRPRYASDEVVRKHVDAYPTIVPRALAALGLCLGLALLSPGLALGSPQLPPPRELVVIDPGHGGANLGAPGRGGLLEKQLTLQVARRLGRLLAQSGYRVTLTREGDRYLTLRERVRRANASQPALFLSLHANASPDHSQRGVETFVLDRHVAEVEARRQSRRSGEPVKGLLSDLRAAQQLRESMRLGRAVQESLVSLRGAVDRGLRQADFDVLAGVLAPAVLVEVGFIDHVIEGPLLAEPAVQEQIALALHEGVKRYLEERGQVPVLSAPRRVAPGDEAGLARRGAAGVNVARAPGASPAPPAESD